jgi:hypothetical protein
MQRRLVASAIRRDADQMGAKKQEPEWELFYLPLQPGVAEAQKYGIRDDAKWSQRTEKPSRVRNQRNEQAVKRQDRSEQVQPPKKMTRHE